MTALFGGNGQPVQLGQKLGAGGQAAIHEVISNPQLVAKVYHPHQLPDAAQTAKLRYMTANPPTDPMAKHGHRSIAWPQDLLTDGKQVVGFLMPRIDQSKAVDLHDVSNPRKRRKVAPAFTWQYLLRIARNFASALGALHAKGYVVGDVNESNLKVYTTALVTVIDCDSMQVSDSTGRVYRCEVGKSEYTAPELIGQSFRNVDRTPYSDSFAYAILTFQLLMQGVHPFTGVWRGSGPDPTMEQLIKLGCSPYVPGNERVISAPDHVLSFDILPPGLQALFLKCFGAGHADPTQRPSARAWERAIADAEAALTTCASNTQHVYSGHLRDCPWCQRMKAKRVPDPFPPSTIGLQQPLPAVPVGPPPAPTPVPALPRAPQIVMRRAPPPAPAPTSQEKERARRIAEARARAQAARQRPAPPPSPAAGPTTYAGITYTPTTAAPPPTTGILFTDGTWVCSRNHACQANFLVCPDDGEARPSSPARPGTAFPTPPPPPSPAPGTIRCPRCGATAHAHEIYCQRCSHQLAATLPCRHCGRPMPAKAYYCPSCGKRF